MEDFERAFIDAVIQNVPASIASNLRELLDQGTFVESEDRLTPRGRMFVFGYVTGQLTLVRAATTGNPNLSATDISEVRDCIDAHENHIAAALYA
jgi:hypothetical protein